MCEPPKIRYQLVANQDERLTHAERLHTMEFKFRADQADIGNPYERAHH